MEPFQFPKENINTEPVKRGEVYFVVKNPADPAVGSEEYAGRPAVVVSNDKNNRFSNTITVVYLTTQPKKDLPTHATIRSTPKACTALAEQIGTISKDRLDRYYSTLTEREMQQIDVCIMIHLGLDYPEKTADPARNDLQEEIARLKIERDAYRKLCVERMEK